MRKYVATSIRFLVFAVTVMFLSSPTVLASDCPPTKPATNRGPIAPNGPWIAYQCPEMCNLQYPPVFTRYYEPPDLIDLIYVWCDGVNGAPGEEKPIPSTSTCWKCLDGCAGSNCPAGEICEPNAGQWGSDCIRYGCDDPNYEPVEDSTAPGGVICRRKTTASCPESCTPATVVLDGPTTIQPGATCEWSAAASSSTCSASAYTYHWYAANHWVGSGQYYSGGKPSGVLNGYPWKLRVEVLYNGTPAGSKEIQVSESSNAPVCFY